MTFQTVMALFVLLPLSLGLGVAPFDIRLTPAEDGDEFPLANIFHSSTFSIELIESSDTSSTDCWYSRAPFTAGPMPLGPVGVDIGIGVGPPMVP